jgi:hypothetical protein
MSSEWVSAVVADERPRGRPRVAGLLLRGSYIRHTTRLGAGRTVRLDLLELEKEPLVSVARIRSQRLPSAPRLGQIALGLFWLIDGILECQPFLLRSTLVTDVMDPVAAGQPRIVGDPIRWVGSLIEPHTTIFGLLIALSEIVIGIGLLNRRTVKPALVASCLCAIGITLFGEGLGGLLTGATPSTLMGIVSGAPLYIVASLLVWPDSRRGRVGAFSKHAARGVFAALWLATAVLWLFPANNGSSVVRETFSSAPSGAGWLASIESSAASATAGAGVEIALAMAAISALIAYAALTRTHLRLALGASIAISLTLWVLAEGLGGLFTGQATDIGVGPLMALIACTVLAPVPAPVSAYARVRRQTVGAA